MAQTVVLGIHQSDLIIRTAIMAGLHELRQKPHLLDYCFASLPQDTMTAADYGEKEIAEAKRWFLSTNIPVVFNRRLGEMEFPCITIALLKSSESRNTLSDVNYEVKEETVPPEGWPNLTDPFVPVSYDRKSGQLRVPDAVAKQLILTSGQVLVTKRQNRYPILDVIDSTTFVVAPNINEELNDSVIRGGVPPKLVMLDSARFSETYAIGVHVQSEPVHLVHLHSILVFVLLRNRRRLLEGRGLECTSLDSGDFSLGRMFEGVEAQPIFSRFIQLSGEVLQWWPESEDDRIATTVAQPRIAGGGKLIGDPAKQVDASIVGDEDSSLEELDFFLPPRK